MPSPLTLTPTHGHDVFLTASSAGSNGRIREINRVCYIMLACRVRSMTSSTPNSMQYNVQCTLDSRKEHQHGCICFSGLTDYSISLSVVAVHSAIELLPQKEHPANSKSRHMCITTAKENIQL